MIRYTDNAKHFLLTVITLLVQLYEKLEKIVQHEILIFLFIIMRYL